MTTIASTTYPLATIDSAIPANTTHAPSSRAPRRRARVAKGLDGHAEARHDDALMTRVATGDIEAAAELRDRHARRMARVAKSILGDRIEARRAVDIALEEACNGWPPARGRVERWLSCLARRAARARQRELFGVAA